MFFLALDCSTSLGSVALMREADENHRHVFGHREFAAGRGQGGRMFIALQDALEEIKAAAGRLDGILVGVGPGSYSGVRQSIAAATGLAAATGAWLRGVPSVVGLKHGGGGLYQVIGDARRGAFYYTVVRKNVCVVGPELLADASELNARLAERPDWQLYAVESAPPGGLFLDAVITFPTAGNLFAAPFSSHLDAPLEPIYLRPVNITLPRAVQPAVP